MAIIYWVEDEIERLEGTKALLEQNGDEVRVINNASGMLRSLGDIKNSRGPIIFDLWIPPGDLPQAQNYHRGPDTGLAVLEEIRAHLGPNWQIWIVSGNLTRGLKERLMKEFGISLDRIFSKPLNDRNDSLVEGVLAELSTLAVSTSARSATSPAKDQQSEVK